MTVGIDITSVSRFRAVLARFPAAEERFFSRTERHHCRSHPDPVIHFAGTFAAKEAVVKALGLGPIRAWARKIEITRDGSGAPTARVLDAGLEEPVTLSISHDADVAVAIAIRTAPTTGRTAVTAPPTVRVFDHPARRREPAAASGGNTRNPEANGDLQRFLGVHRSEPALPAPVLTRCSEAGWGSDFP